jgi:hypothetical protein
MRTMNAAFDHGVVRAPSYTIGFASANGPEDAPPQPAPFDRATAAREDLPYRVELWDAAKRTVEQVLAVTSSGSIGYAAYYAATREHPQRFITLRHKSNTIARWNGPEH